MSNSTTFVTSGGVTLTLKAVPPMLVDRVRNSVKPPEPPTYEAKTVAGDVEIHVHDETTLTTDEEKAAWAKYQMDLAAYSSEMSDRMSRVLLHRGIEFDYDPEGEWADDQRFLDIEIPDDPRDRRLHYLMTEIFLTTDDLTEVLLQILQMTGITEKVMADVRASFRGDIRRDASGDADRGTPTEE